ncbi:MAG: B12-binding domain-containing radical SAM protein, partial [Promethearchaeota archaeon]
VHGYKIRYRSPESVIDEIKHLKNKFSANEIYIIDDNFTLNRKRTDIIFDRIIDEQLNLSITFSNGIRADTLTPDLLIKMKRAGTAEFAIGVESGNQLILNKIGKSLSLKKVRRVARYIHKLGFIFKCFFIIGHPFDTPATMMDTINFAIELEPEVAQFSKATPWPGTELYQIIKKHGVFIKKLNTIESFNLFASQFKIWHVTPKLMNKYFILAYFKFYLRPKKIMTFIRKIKTYRQLKWYVSNAIMILIRMISS